MRIWCLRLFELGIFIVIAALFDSLARVPHLNKAKSPVKTVVYTHLWWQMYTYCCARQITINV